MAEHLATNAVATVEARMMDLGLTLAPTKTQIVVFRPKGQRREPAKVLVGKTWITSEPTIKYLGLAAQVITGHGGFNAFLYGIKKAEYPYCDHCGSDEDSAQHTLAACPAWVRERLALVSVIGPDLSLASIIERSVNDQKSWLAFLAFCEAVMLTKEEAERICQGQRR
ncbi:uncharacterized protein LOC109860284 [Pseudomyrmex gracilis]|uniref:uncharacterized protein LOC109860284 n=1 Tax=Pseudomyrmex gracilis TaxID=219809 RepID=UPI00099578DA|nr:uncharacterized protein LOC109860284 [Pseudomyrmex gracilis]